jgi:ATP-dependent RNA helicase DeaD
MSKTTFAQLGIIDPVLQVCNEEKFIHPTEIQKKSIPYVIKGKDVIAQAATGSGKTLSFASGIIQKTVKGKGIQALVVTPTRELAQQLTDMITDLSKYKPIRILSVYGGVSINPQIRELSRADVVIGTPGRLIDHIERRTINLRSMRILVLDECDRLLDMGFLPDVEKIIFNLPKNRQTLLYSATISYDVSQIAQKYMNNPIEVGAKSYVDPHKLRQFYYGPVNNSIKFSLLVHLLNQHNGNGMSMIFCNTRRNVDSIGKNLHLSGIKAAVLHGGYSQHERSRRLNSFHSGKVKILVATDVAARGLDIQGVSYIYNYDLPNNYKQYIHRIGRTARAGKSGKAITLVAQRDNEDFFHLFRDHRGIQKVAVPYVKKIPFKTKRRPASNRRNQYQNRRKPDSNRKYSRYSF